MTKPLIDSIISYLSLGGKNSKVAECSEWLLLQMFAWSQSMMMCWIAKYISLGRLLPVPRKHCPRRLDRTSDGIVCKVLKIEAANLIVLSSSSFKTFLISSGSNPSGKLPAFGWTDGIFEQPITSMDGCTQQDHHSGIIHAFMSSIMWGAKQIILNILQRYILAYTCRSDVINLTKTQNLGTFPLVTAVYTWIYKRLERKDEPVLPARKHMTSNSNNTCVR